MRRAAEGASALERRIGADRNAIEGWNGAEQGLVVVGEGALDYGVEIGVAAAEKEVGADSAFDRCLNSLGAKRLGVDGQLVGEVRLQDSFECLLLGGREIGQKLGDEVQANVFNLFAELVVKVAGA